MKILRRFIKLSPAYQFLIVFIVISALVSVSVFKFLDLLSIISFSVVAGLIGGFIAYSAKKITNHAEKIEKRIWETENELQSTINISKFTKLPLLLGNWAISAHFLEHLVREIYLRKPNLIVECGSGTSTLVSAACLKDIGKGKIISFDHEDYYALKTRNLLKVEGLENIASVITAPIKEINIADRNWKWYGAEIDKIISEKIDILVVDGPPGKLQPLSRYPAVLVLKEYLADDILIMLDDGNREDEEKIAKAWAEEINAKAELNGIGSGFWRIHKK